MTKEVFRKLFMFIAANIIKRDSQNEYDVCIIGAGAAGITLALSLKDSALNICILESGGLDRDYQTQKLNDIETTDLPIGSPSRARQFGGTTTLWVGRWKPHDKIDFEKRDWITNSGWPISLYDLEPYYKKSAELLSVPEYEQFKLSCQDLKNQHIIDSHNIETSIFRWLEKKDFDWGKKYKKEFTDLKNITVLLGANAVGLKTYSNSNSVEKVQVKTITGNSFNVKAKIFILASGGLENARILLISDIGNEYDQVGRYYMDHPKGLVGEVELFNKNVDLALYWGLINDSKQVRAGLKIKDEIQKQNRILNSYVLLEPVFPWSYNPGMQAVIGMVQLIKGRKIPFNIIKQHIWEILANQKIVFSFLLNELYKKFLNRTQKVSKLKIWNFLEQEPRPENRVSLSNEKDLLGLPKIKLNWSLGQLDKKTMIEFHKILETELKNLGIGKLNSPLLNHNLLDWPISGDASHHMGTTRMGDDPKTSVVDKNCKVHSIDNLYVAGSSVFTTSGYANPTYTICALAVRLAEHIKNKIA